MTMCYSDCSEAVTATQTRTCGTQCLNGGAWECFTHIVGLIIQIAQAAVQTATLVLSLGASAPASAAGAAAKNSLRQVAKKKLKMMAKSVRDGAIKKWMRKKAKTWVKQKVKEYLKKWMAHAREVIKEEIKEMVSNMATGQEAIVEDGLLQNVMRENHVAALKQLDPTGIVAAIDSSASKKPAHEQAQAWLAVIANVDPTGWAAVAQAFAKPKCTWMMQQMNNEAGGGCTGCGIAQIPVGLDDLQTLADSIHRRRRAPGRRR